MELLTITTQINYIVGITFRILNDKNIVIRQNSSCFKELEYLKQLTT